MFSSLLLCNVELRFSSLLGHLCFIGAFHLCLKCLLRFRFLIVQVNLLQRLPNQGLVCIDSAYSSLLQ